ncbi:DoxX-like protein [Tamaricihabitans halophyticus]|uniref:DoxX-like protein n=1 Tax=Tamaricihabitans halophyticus TaxID=1262583 RepID=A0A4V2SUC0_9PSEU|nr:DoxX family protein [Tamaricihabitans halophyticus]TCP53526.1 DoxX-like protein [Tamaricihabitans halophyticus]
MIDPWWPLAALAFVQLGDGVLCIQPVSFIRKCLVDVRFPQRFWWLLPVLKFAAAAGLVVGIWFTPLAILTSAALTCYFVIALAAHVHARDFGRNLFVNCTGMLLASAATLTFVLIAG